MSSYRYSIQCHSVMFIYLVINDFKECISCSLKIFLNICVKKVADGALNLIASVHRCPDPVKYERNAAAAMMR